MLMPSGSFRLFMYPSPIDMRAGYDRLAFLCREELGMDPYAGAIFLFFNRSKTLVKIFYHDGSGSCVFGKRLDRGRFTLPSVTVGSRYGSIAANELGLLLEGVDTRLIQHPRHDDEQPS